MENKDERNSLFADVGLLSFLALFGATAILMVLSGNLFLNTIYLFCTIALLMMTYFFGILPSLISNITFIAIQAVVMIYQYLNKSTAIPWQLSFWMVIPILLSLALYTMTKNQIALQKSNGELRTALIERGALMNKRICGPQWPILKI